MAGYEDIRVGVSDAITRPRRVVVQYDWQNDSLHAYCNDGVSVATIPQPE